MNPATPTRPSNGTLEVPTVLCIDDDPDVTCAIEIYLRQYDVKVVRAFHGMHGFAEAIHARPNVIVMDVSMPNGDGGTVLDLLRHNRRTESIPVIILSGIRDQQQKWKLSALGANRFVRKPARLEDLAREIGRFVQLRKRSDEQGDSEGNHHG
jgi:CheY-like chemotaxis protein